MQRLLPGVRTGRVMTYASHKGFGFIEDQGTAAHVFVHYSSLVRKSKGRRDLWLGEYVNFVVLPDRNGRMGACIVTGINGGPLMCESHAVVPFS